VFQRNLIRLSRIRISTIGSSSPGGGIEMATDSTATVIPMTKQLRLCNRPVLLLVARYWALTKPKVNLLIVTTVVAGFCTACHTSLQSFPYLRLLHALIGTMLAASGAGALNQVIEKPLDALMSQTRMRRAPQRTLGSGSISPHDSLWFGISLASVGVIYLALAVNPLSSCIAVLTIASYLFVYTPLKRRTPLCTFVGALSGAAPPLIGWAAASGSLNLEAWTLYLLLFFWQFPHFMAKAWIYRHDYDRAGYKVLPRCKRRRKFIGVQSVVPALLLILVNAIPTLNGDPGRISLIGAMLLSSIFLFYAVRLAIDRSNHAAHQLLFASVVYLPSILLLMLLNKK
jgi:protoheme IX farnesyltransferase